MPPSNALRDRAGGERGGKKKKTESTGSGKGTLPLHLSLPFFRSQPPPTGPRRGKREKKRKSICRGKKTAQPAAPLLTRPRATKKKKKKERPFQEGG